MPSADTPVRVMIVEDSAVVRRLLVHIVSSDPRLTVVAAVETAEEALAQIERLRPDVISMDIRLPGMDGLEAIGRIMTDHPTPIVVIADAIQDASLRISLNALREGALAVVEKPVAPTNAGYDAVADTICTQLRIMAEVPVIRRRTIGGRPTGPAAFAVARAVLRPEVWAGSGTPPAVVAIAASTGGPPALARLLGGLDDDYPSPILVVQHMGAAFMEGFAGWLDGQSSLDVRVARHGEIALPGTVYVAPGDRHLVCRAGGLLQISDAPKLGGQRPSATVLFESVAAAFGPRAVGVLLTGMGEDGATGLVALRRAGGYTITEDESTAVVYGMPAAAVRMGGSCLPLPIDLIGPRLVRLARGGRT